MRDSEGRVTRVIAEAKEKKLIITTKCVIIASGGYGMNPEFLKKNPYYNRDTMVNANHGVHSNTGDGIVMATKVGAATVGIGHIMFHEPQAPMPAGARMKIREDKYPASMLVRDPQTMWLNKQGMRFIDEGHNLASFASPSAVAQQPDGIMFSVFDDRTRQSIEEDVMIWLGAYGEQKYMHPQYKRPLAGQPLPGLGRELQAIAKENIDIIITDSLEELADYMGAKPAVLKQTIKEYNNACARVHDPIFCKDRRYLLPMATTPYYALKG